MKSADIRLWVIGTLIAALVPALLLPAVLGIGLGVIPLAFVVGLAHAAIGLPIAFLVMQMRWMNVVSAAVMGFAIGVLPMGLVIVRDLGYGNAVPVGDVMPTLAFLGACGSAGGIGFWIVLYIGGAFDVRRRP